jgi:hypothetical protein
MNKVLPGNDTELTREIRNAGKKKINIDMTVVFAYPQFYFSIMKSISILSAATVEAAAQAY